MRLRRAIRWGGILFAFAWSGPVLADAPCVGAGFNIPLPGAVDVDRRIVDVASAHSAGLWQEGRVNDVVYRVFANRTGMIADDLIRPGWRIEIFCDAADTGCRQEEIGTAPERGHRLADALAICMTGTQITASDVTDGATGIDGAGGALSDADTPFAEGPVPACAEPVPTDENEQVRQAQTILLQIGLDPGPVDGLLGPLTLAALMEDLGPGVTLPTTQAALDALRAAHCPN
ncbi:peptidoglycan-binding protein [Rhodophyticola sp. CCM32]|uniref:peptidoglycan-binding domain-containing protein n=1 Tax=Rhodophyticola sp. CCM32 TaxID=2916397 RepID=UPI00107FB8C1|nr:peptidoglycan-binding protein [Rhodophyticola sp. CCM32]QBY01240.1 peptidoglycan-binding protein [Rhodophyticola sp. CCM32]